VKAEQEQEKIAAQNVLDRSYTGYIDLYIDSELVKFKLISRIRKGDIVYATLHPIDEPMELSNCMFCRVDPKANEIFQYMYVLDPNIPEELNEIDKVITKTAELLNKRANDSEQKQTYSTPDKYEGLEEADYYRSYEKAEKTAAKNIFDPTFSGHIELPFDSGTIEKFKILYRIKKGDIVYAILLNENDPLEVRNFNFVRVDPKEENELFKYVYFLDPKDDEEFNEIDIVMKKYREGLKKING